MSAPFVLPVAARGPSPAPATDPLDAHLDAAALDHLAERRWCVVDGFAGRADALATRAAGQALDAADGMQPAGLSRGREHRLDRAVRGDRIAWVNRHREVPAFARAGARFDALRLELNRAAYLGLTRFGLQLATYPGDGAGYVRHRDAFPGSINRKITAIWYLNPGWRPAHGGALRLFVPGEPLIEPRLDRLLVFFSEEIEHAVEPAWAPRWAMTAWMRKPDPRRPAL